MERKLEGILCALKKLSALFCSPSLHSEVSFHAYGSPTTTTHLALFAAHLCAKEQNWAIGLH